MKTKNIQTVVDMQDYLYLHNKAASNGMHLKDLVKDILLSFIKSLKEAENGEGVK